MKNLLKKTVKKEIKSTIEKIDKKQLEKITGGAETSKGDQQKLDTILNLIR
mgnify:CR=1 FL=1